MQEGDIRSPEMVNQVLSCALFDQGRLVGRQACQRRNLFFGVPTQEHSPEHSAGTGSIGPRERERGQSPGRRIKVVEFKAG